MAGFFQTDITYCQVFTRAPCNCYFIVF